MRRNTSSSLRFPSVMYDFVHSRRESRTLLVLFASLHLRRVYTVSEIDEVGCKIILPARNYAAFGGV